MTAELICLGYSKRGAAAGHGHAHDPPSNSCGPVVPARSSRGWGCS